MATASSHLVLARKWRPERFSELVGQEQVTRILVKALESGRIAHAFLFTGIRGVGKTTAARILARCLNCERGPRPEPCGECAACLEIRAGSALDVVEIDGATYRKIDDARAIIENLSYRPARDRFKIYIIDEAHQLTDQAFNALLKTLEEPPAHVKFILATTEPQKMPETILSRLQRYDFRRIPFDTIVARLKELAAREGLKADDGALRLLAREAGGSMRDAERMLETALAPLDAALTEEDAALSLGVAARTTVFAIIEAILNKDGAAALKKVRALFLSGANLESLGRDLLEALRNLTIASLAPGDGGLLEALPDQEAAELRRLSALASGRDLMRLFRLMAQAQEEILRSPYADMLLEMAVVRMAALQPVMDAEELLRAIDAAGSGTPPGGGAKRRAGEPAEPPSAGARRLRVEGEVKASAPLRKPPAGALDRTAGGELTQSFARGPSGSFAGAPQEASGRTDETFGGLGGGPGDDPEDDFAADLPDLRAHIRQKRPALFGFMEKGAALKMDAEGGVITVTPRSAIYARYLGDNRNAIAELASELYGRPIRAELGRGNGAARPTASPAPSGAPESQNEVKSAGEPAFAQPGARSAQPSAPERDGDEEGRKLVYGDPLARRIFDQLEARLVEVRTPAIKTDKRGQE